MADKKVIDMPQEGKKNEVVKDATTETNVVKFGKPYNFEGTEYTEIDLAGLDKLTINDAVKAQLQLLGEQEVATAILCETTTAFARVIACKATGLPIEFFKLMPRGAARAVRQAVQTHINVSAAENHVITFEKPYIYKGQTYTSVDLYGIADLNSMNDSAAENRIAREGFPITENSTNYLFACAIASMATGLDEEFFTGLPLCEVLKLKNAVSDSSFFE